MRYVAAYMLATLGGKSSPSAKDIETILGSVGIEAESDKIKKVLDELKGKDISQVIAEGEKKLASMPSGGSAVAASGGSAAAPAGGASDAKAAEKKEEKKEEPEEESDDDMGFGLFD